MFDVFSVVAAAYLRPHWYNPSRQERPRKAEGAGPVLIRLAIAAAGVGLFLVQLGATHP